MTNVGLVGCGYWGPNYARLFNEVAGSRLAWACDKDPARFAPILQRYPQTRTTTIFSEMLEDASLDAVVVATPASTHGPLVRAALEAGKHVLVEKPITTTSAEARELARVAERAGRVLMVGHVFEFNAAVRRMAEYHRSGELGDLYYVYMTRTGLGPIRQDVNVMWDLVPHDVSVLLHLFDGAMPTEVAAEGATFLQPGREDVVFATLRFPNGVLAHLHASWLDPNKIRRTTLIGSKKMLVLDDVNALEPIRLYSKGADLKPHVAPDTFGEFQVSLRDGDILIPKVPVAEPLRVQVEHFLDCVRTGKKPLVDAERGARVVEVCERIDAALKKKA